MTILSSRQQYWLEKIFAFLHDPPSKTYDMFVRNFPHELKAQEFIKMLKIPFSYLTDEKKQHIKNADRLASGFDRFLIDLVFNDSMKRVSPEWEQIVSIKTSRTIEIIDPWNSRQKSREYYLERPKVARRSVQKIVKFLKNIPEERRYLIMFHLLFRVFPFLLTDGERELMFLYPADTRVPDHSLYDHVTLTSAVSSALPRPKLLLFSIGPVQEFIATARKTADFYAGSYVLSYLTWMGMRPIVKSYGPDHIIYPCLLFQGLYELSLLQTLGKQHKEIFNLLKTKTYPWNRVVQVPGLPNRFMAVVPQEESKTTNTLEQRVIQSAHEGWKRSMYISLLVCLDLYKNGNRAKEQTLERRFLHYMKQVNRVPEDAWLLTDNQKISDCERKWIKDIFESQGASCFYIHATSIPLTLDNTSNNDIDQFFDKEVLQHILAKCSEYTGKRQKDAIDVIKTVMKYPPYKKIGVPVSIAYPLVSGILNTFHRALRDMNHLTINSKPQVGRLCSLCGERVEIGTLWAIIAEAKEKTFTQVNEKSDEFWENLRAGYMTEKKGFVLVREGEYLCGVCITKRLFPFLLRVKFQKAVRAFRKTKKEEPYYQQWHKVLHFLDMIRFPSVREIASTTFKMWLVNTWLESSFSEKEKILNEFVTFLEKTRETIEPRPKFRSWHVPYLRRWFHLKKKENNVSIETQMNLKKLLRYDSSLFTKEPLSENEFYEFFMILSSNMEKERHVSGRMKAKYQGIYEEYCKYHKKWVDMWEKIGKKFKTKMPSNPTYYALVFMDGDNMGHYVNGDCNPPILHTYHTKLQDAIKNAQDEWIQKFKNSRHPMTPAWHRMLSRRLAEFSSRELIKLFYEKYPAQLVYAGGDDVVFFAPVEVVLPLAYEIRKLFKEKVLPDGDMSAGIVIVHEKFPLHLAIEEARNAEKRAKSKRGRSAFELCVIKRSGDRETCGFKWDAGVINGMNIFEKLIRVFVEKNENIPLSSRFPYKLAELYQDAGLLSEHASEKELSDIKELATSLLRFAFSRSLEKKGDESQCHELLEQLVTLLNAEQVTPANFAQGLLNINFIARQSVKPIFKPQNGGS